MLNEVESSQKQYPVVCLDKASDDYPKLLKEIPQSPEKIYVKGNFNPHLFDNCLSVVGSRKITPYAKVCLKHIFSTLNSNEISVVSGFMTGVDAQAHLEALNVGIKTIAVMPCGIDYIHPEDQEDLYYRILENGGLIISEYEGILPPKKWTYPKRNRIVAGLSLATLIVECTLNSGTLITAELAHVFNRQVLCVPVDIFSQTCEGFCYLVNNYARSVTSGFEINDFYGVSSLTFPEKQSKGGGDISSTYNLELQIIEILKKSSLTFDELCSELNIPSDQISLLNSKITLLILNGKITEVGGKFNVC